MNYRPPLNPPYRKRRLAGTYGAYDFPLPSNSLAAMVPAAAAAVKAAANLAVKTNGRGMAGAWGPQAASWPGAYSRRSMPTLSGARAGMGFATSDVTDWLKNNPGTAAAIAIGAVLLLGMGRRRRR